MEDSTFFCAELSRNSKEVMYWTATNYNHLILIECNENWGEYALHESKKIPENVKNYIDAFLNTKTNVRVLLIKKDNQFIDTIKISHFYAKNFEVKTNSININKYEELLSIDFDEFIQQAKPITKSTKTILICTNGLHDKCCARYGYALYVLLKDKMEFDVWQCTHIWWDRFAPNLIVLPNARYIWGINNWNLKQFIDDVCSDKIPILNYRGNFGIPVQIQYAEYYLLKYLENNNIWKINFVSEEQSNKNTTIILQVNENSLYRVEIKKTQKDIKNYLTCSSKEQESPLYYNLVNISIID